MLENFKLIVPISNSGTRTYSEDLKTGNIEHSNEAVFASLSVECLVDLLHKPGEHSLVKAFGESPDGVLDLLQIPALLYVLIPNTDARFDERFDQVDRVDTEQMSNLLSLCTKQAISLNTIAPQRTT